MRVGRVRQPRAWYRRARYATAFAAGCILVALSGVPAFALSVPGAPAQPTVARGNASIIVTFSPSWARRSVSR